MFPVVLVYTSKKKKKRESLLFFKETAFCNLPTLFCTSVDPMVVVI